MPAINLTVAQLEAESNKFHTIFEEGESEGTWIKFDNALSRMADITCGSWELLNFAAIVKQKWKFGIVACLNSDRTKLAKDCLMLIQTMSTFLKERFDESLLIPILKLCGKANKIIVNSASATLIHCINSGNGFPCLIPHFTDAHKNPSKTFRIAAINCLVATVECCTRSQLDHYVEKVEFAICVYIIDSVPQVRELARLLYSAYQVEFNTDKLVASLTETSKKYLKIEERSQSWKTPKRENLEHGLQTKQFSSSRAILKAVTSPDINQNYEKPAQGLVTVKNSSQASSKLVLFSKAGFKEPLTKKAGELKEISLGGAMRVLREPVASMVTDGTNRPTIKALRVPSMSCTIADVSTKPIAIESSNIPARVEIVDKKPVKRKIVVAEFKTKKSENVPDLATLYSRAKSSDWQARCKAYESLIKLVDSNDFKRSEIISPKMTEMILLGLDDTHFRVVNSVYDVIECILERNLQIESFFVKTVTTIYNSYNSKSRQSSFEHSEELIRKMVVSLNECAIPNILNLLSEPGLMRKPKAKNGLLIMLCSVRLEYLSSYISKATNFKLFLQRIACVIPDIEEKTQQLVKEMIKALYSSNADHFWSIWNGLKVIEQNRFNKLFGNNISEHREILGETHNSDNTVLKLQSHSRIPVIHASPIAPLTKVSMTDTAHLESSLIKMEVLDDQNSQLEDKQIRLTDKTLKDEQSYDVGAVSEVEDIPEDGNHSTDLNEGVEGDQDIDQRSVELLSPDSSKQVSNIDYQSVEPEISSIVEKYDNLVSDFVHNILEVVVVQSREPDDSQILAYIHDMLDELVKELKLPATKEDDCLEVENESLTHTLEIAPAAESLQQWHIPSESTNVEEAKSLTVEPWYVPSWSKTSTSTVTIHNLPDILSTLKTSANEDELHSCLILLQSLLESHDADNFCPEILSALLENKTPLCLPDLDLKESMLSKFPQYFSSDILFSSLEKSCPTSLRVCLSVLNELLTLSQESQTLLKDHSDWKKFLIQGLQSNRSATRHISIKLFQQVSSILDSQDSQIMWRQVETLCKSGSQVSLIKTMMKYPTH